MKLLYFLIFSILSVTSFSSSISNKNAHVSMDIEHINIIHNDGFHIHFHLKKIKVHHTTLPKTIRMKNLQLFRLLHNIMKHGISIKISNIDNNMDIIWNIHDKHNGKLIVSVDNKSHEVTNIYKNENQNTTFFTNSQYLYPFD